MLRATIWRDLRWRLLAGTTIVGPLATLVAWSYASQPSRPSATSSIADHLTYLDAAWFRLPGASAAFLPVAILPGANGGLLRPRNDVAYLLALPVSRRRWLFTHLAMSLAALAALTAAASLVLAAGALFAGMPVAAGPILGRSLAVFIAAAPWICLTAGVLSVVRHPALAVAIMLAIVALLPTTWFRLQLPARAPTGVLAHWDPWALADPRAWEGGVPVVSLVVAIGLGAAGTLLALQRVERFEP